MSSSNYIQCFFKYFELCIFFLVEGLLFKKIIGSLKTVFFLNSSPYTGGSGLQIRRSNKDNLGITGHISSEKHIL